MRRLPLIYPEGRSACVAVAGVLAMRPEYLILDEPAAGLDPRGRDELFDRIAALRDKTRMTVILVSHSMERCGNGNVGPDSGDGSWKTDV